MQREKFANWLKTQKGYRDSTVNSRLGNCSTIEYYEGDLDDLYDTDRCVTLLESMEYFKTDREKATLPKHHIPITGDVYAGTATLKSSLKLYVEFKDNNASIKPSHTLRQVSVSRQKKTSIISTYFDYKPTLEQLTTLKQIIADTVIFFPPEVFGAYLHNNVTSHRAIQREWPYLIFSKRKEGLRMRRGKVASEIKRTQIENPDDQTEMIFLTDNANGRFNTEFGNAFEEVYGKRIPPDRYSICHIGGNTAYDVSTFAAIPNVVYAPTWIERVTDDSPEIRRLLTTRSYELYGEMLKKALQDAGKSERTAEAQIRALYLAMQSPREGLDQEVARVFPPEYQCEEDQSLRWKDWRK